MTVPATGTATSVALPPAAGGRPDVSVVIVSFNTRELLAQCLQSIQDTAGGVRAEIIVVDNGSADGSVELVERDFPAVRLIRSAENLGFAAANNRGFDGAKGEFVLLLNPDTELHQGALETSLAFLRANPGIGALGCRVRYPHGEQQSTIFRTLTLRYLVLNLFIPARFLRRNAALGRSRYVGWDLDRPHEVEVIAGCFMLIPHEVLRRVGGMDPEFFMYGEEAEWCYRIRKAGWSVVYWPGASITHYAGQSAKQVPDAMVAAMSRSQLALLRKTGGRGVAYVGNWLILLRDLPRAAVWVLLTVVPGMRRSRLRQLLRPAVIRARLHITGIWRLRGGP